MRTSLITIALLSLFLTACSVNPVTGKRDFMIVSSAQEIEMGKQRYAPMQQSEGGAYDIDPELTRYVQRVGSQVAAQSGVNLPYEFVVLNNSVPNAWALPGGKIAINRGLLTELGSEAELAAVLGHEAVHAAARHTAQQISRSQVAQVGVAATAIAASDSDYGNLAAGGAMLLAQMGLSRYGRSAELESDRYGMEYMSKAGYDPQGAVHLQETFVRLNDGRRSDWISGLFASHPPSPERVAANRATAARLPAGGKLGIQEYNSMIKGIVDAEPAYDAYDDGREALAKKNYSQALSLANRALDLYGAEAHFHALRGDVRLAQNNYDAAITNYDRAINRRNGFFYYHLQRGLANKELGRRGAAETDLKRSIELLPTAPAYYALGNIAEQRGNRSDAIGFYKVVAQAGGSYGTAATEQLVRLDLPANPAAYLPRACDADSRGNLIVSVRNDTSVQVTNIVVAVNYNDRSGRPISRSFSIRGQIPPGQIGSVNTGIGPYTGGNCPAQVVDARIAR